MTAHDTRYNGWTNYPTWNVNLWLDNEEYLCNELLPEMAREAYDDTDDDLPSEERKADAVGPLADALEAYVTDPDNCLIPAVKNGPGSDLLTWALGQVEWREIAEHLLDNLEVEENVGADGEPIL